MTTMNTEPSEREEAPSDTRTLLRRLKDFLFDNCNHNERDRNYDWCPSCVMVFMDVVAQPSDTELKERLAQVEKENQQQASLIEDFRHNRIGAELQRVAKEMRAIHDDILSDKLALVEVPDALRKLMKSLPLEGKKEQ